MLIESTIMGELRQLLRDRPLNKKDKNASVLRLNGFIQRTTALVS